MSKFPIEVKDGALNFGVDSNEDGEQSVSGKLHLAEAIGEALAKGTQIEGAKVVDFKFELTKLVLKIDSDKDGQPLLELTVDLGEAFDEVKGKLAK